MPITPNDGHSIVALPLHVRRVDIPWHLIDLEDLAAIDLVDAPGTLTLDAKLVGVYRLP